MNAVFLRIAIGYNLLLLCPLRLLPVPYSCSRNCCNPVPHPAPLLAILNDLRNRFPEQILDFVHAAIIRQLQQYSVLLLTGVFLWRTFLFDHF